MVEMQTNLKVGPTFFLSLPAVASRLQIGSWLLPVIVNQLMMQFIM
jgi:hypothetical protein